MQRKKEFTSFDVAAVVGELKNVIEGSRVNNVYQLDSKILLFKLHKPDKPAFHLVLEAGERLHLTSYAMEKPSTPPAFCMALRKYLRNATLANVEQHEFERVVVFTFKGKMGDLRLVLEIFGDGNIILVDSNGKILHALAYKRMRDRNILRNEPFTFAPSRSKNPFKVSKEELTIALRSFGNVEVVRAIARFLGIGGIYAEEVLLRAGIEKTKPCNKLNDSEVHAFFDCLQNLLMQVINGKLEPCIILDEKGEFMDFVPFRLKRYEKLKHQFYGSFNEALDEFYVRAEAFEKVRVSVEAEKLKEEAERFKRVIESQEKILAETEAEANSAKRIGDAIYAHAGELQALLDKFLNGKKAGKNWSDVVSEVLAEKKTGKKPSIFFDSFDAKGLVIYVCVESLRFGLGLRKKLFDIAAQYYERSKKAKQKLAGAKVAMEENRKKLMEIEAKIQKAEALESAKPFEILETLEKRRVKGKEWFEKFRWFKSSDDFLVVEGKDATTNEVLIKKYTEPMDIVFHADIVGAPFVVIKTDGKEPSEQCLKEAAQFAAAYSRGWREGFATIDVYWVKPEQLSKTGPSGEYVPHGAFVVSGKRNWMRNTPLKIAIGVVEENGETKFVGGPVEAVRAKTKTYAIIVPGEESGKEFLKQILKTLAAKIPKELKEKVLRASVEEIREFIPFGKGRILADDNS
ncbi:MAG: ribosome rescue protein RqcH [Candidatus Bathyarchaeota archaeon]|nr:ribosome rescue protein RqcH [Candidatus Bathyarchaeota archaeon]